MSLGLRLERGWRIVGTGVAILALLWGGITLATGVVPFILLFHRDPIARKRVVLALVSISHRFYIRCLVVFRVLERFRVEGREHIPAGPALFIANHPTILDVVSLFSQLPKASCVVRSDLRRHRFWGGMVRAAGYIPNDDGPQMIEIAKEHFAEGFSLIVFPEGTRSPVDALWPFRLGAARIALHAGVPIIPVTIRAEPGFLRKHEPWWHVPDRRAIFEVTFHPAMSWPNGPGAEGGDPLRVRRLTRAMEAFFQSQLGLPMRAAKTGVLSHA